MLRIAGNAVLNLLKLPLYPLWLALRWLGRPRERWLHVKLRPRVVEVDRPMELLARLMPRMRAAAPTSLSVLRTFAERVVRDPAIEGVVFEIPALATGWAAATSLREVMLALRAGGKQVVAYLPGGGANRELYVASAADKILAAPTATMAPLGVAASARYVKSLLDRVGVRVEVHRRAEYKTAAEAAVRETMSDAQREQIGALLDAVDRALVQALAQRPGMDEAKVRALFDRAMLTGQDAKDAGLVDGLCYEDGLAAALVPEGQPAPKLARAPRWLSYRMGRFFRPVLPRPYVAVVPLHGAIGAGAGVSHASSAATIRTVARDPRALGVVLHIDSPGGSALASDLIHREVELLAKKKPVVAAFGEVAASGGYYVAAPTAAIVAQPLSITGSIGVVSARPVLRDLLENVGVRTEVMRRAPHADLLANPRPLEDAEHEIMEREIDGFYRTFVGVVARGRGRAHDDIEPLARGRVWIGSDARERGLVDRLGGLDAAVDEVRRRLPIAEALRARVEPRVLWPRPGAEPPPPLSASTLAPMAIALLDPQLAELVTLIGSGEHALFYAMGLPRID